MALSREGVGVTCLTLTHNLIVWKQNAQAFDI